MPTRKGSGLALAAKAFIRQYSKLKKNIITN
jgi:hypothetical protein